MCNDFGPRYHHWPSRTGVVAKLLQAILSVADDEDASVMLRNDVLGIPHDIDERIPMRTLAIVRGKHRVERCAERREQLRRGPHVLPAVFIDSQLWQFAAQLAGDAWNAHFRSEIQERLRSFAQDFNGV